VNDYDLLNSGRIFWQKSRLLLRRREGKNFRCANIIDAQFVEGAGLLLGNLESVVFALGIWRQRVKFQVLLNQAGDR